MPVRKLGLVFAIVYVCVLSSILLPSVSALSSGDVAVVSISQAEQSMVQAYEAVLDAEKVGANVSRLLVRLNDAAEWLSHARMAFDAGSFEEAINFADLSSNVGSEVKGEAEGLKIEAEDAHATMSLLFTVGSSVGVAFVLVVGWLGYGYFKRGYYRRLLKMRPRVGKV